MFVYYPRLGRITNFQIMSDNARLGDTHYVIERQPDTYSLLQDERYRYVLRNEVSRAELSLGSVPRHYFQPEYTVLRRENRTYLIAKLSADIYTGGEVHPVLLFNIYDITDGTPRDLGREAQHPEGYWSCSYPKLEDDQLVFELTSGCIVSPFASGSLYETRVLQLK